MCTNCYIFKHVIYCVLIFCSAFELALSGHDKSEQPKNHGKFFELIDFFAELDITHTEHLKNATTCKAKYI